MSRMDQIGKTLVFLGLGLAAVGGLIWLSQSVPWLRIGRLPGDLSYQRDGYSIFFPITTMIVISALGTLIFWIVSALRR